MVRQKSSTKQRKSLAGDGRDADGVANLKFAIEECAASVDRKYGWPRSWACYGTPWQQKRRLRDVYSRRGAKKDVFLGTSLTVTLSAKKIQPGMSDSFETWQKIFWTINAAFICKKED